MKTTINGKRYDTGRCECLGEIDHYNNGTYSGTEHLMRASDGTLLVWCYANGQDSYFREDFSEFERFVCGYDTLNDFEMTEEQERLAIKYGLVAIV